MKTSYEKTEFDNIAVIEWSGLGVDSSGAPLNCEMLEPLSVAFEGEFDGAEVVMMGQIGDGFFPLIGLDHGVVSASADGIVRMSRTCLNIKPVVLYGTDKTSVSVCLMCGTIQKRRLGR